MKKVLLVLLAIVMVFSLVACSQNGGTEAPAAEETAEQEPATEEPVTNDDSGDKATEETPSADASSVVTDKDPSEVVIAGMIHAESYFGSNLLAGMQEACDEYGVQLVSMNYNLDASKEAEAVNTYIAQGVDGLISNVQESTPDLYKQAADAGIVVAAVNTTGPYEFLVSNITYDQGGLGAGAVDYAVEFIKENLDSKPVTHMIRVKQGGMTDARGDAFMEGIGDTFGEEYGKAVSQSSTFVVADAMQQTLDALTANPDINIIFCECEDSMLGAYSAIDSAGYRDKVFVFGVDGNEQLCNYLLDENDSIFQGSGAQNAYEMGYQGCKQLIQTIIGEREPTYNEVDYLEPTRINKGDLATVKEYYDQLVTLREQGTGGTSEES